MYSEFVIPLWYTVRRDMLRHNNTVKSSIIGCSSSLVKENIWVLIYATIVLGTSISYVFVGVILHLIAFSVAYEIGYIYTDNIGIRIEKKQTRNVIYSSKIPNRDVFISISIRIFFLALYLILIQPWMNLEIAYLYVFTILIYFTYGSVKENYRIPLFAILRFLKAFVPYAFLLLLLDKWKLSLVLIVIFGTAVFFTIEYASRKLELKYINVHKPKYLWLKYLVIASFVTPYFIFTDISFFSTKFLFITYIASHLIALGVIFFKKWI